MLCRDELKVKSTPTFYFFRNKEQVHMHTEANAGKFEKFILANVREGSRATARRGSSRIPSKIRRRGKTASPAR